jgi:hypothetical protein
LGVFLQQVRKLLLEMIPRLPTNDLLRPYVKPILTLMLKLLQIDNEENVQVCVRIIIELHKQYRPTFNSEVSDICFLCCFCLSSTQLCQDICCPLSSLPSFCLYLYLLPFFPIAFICLSHRHSSSLFFLSLLCAKTALVSITGYLMVNTMCCIQATLFTHLDWIHVCGACYQDYFLRLTICMYRSVPFRL